MKIKDLKVKNFTSLADINLTNLPDLVVFIGKNSSGKSNIINAISLLFLRLDDSLHYNLGDSQDFQHLLINHDTQGAQMPQIQATLTLSGQEWASLFALELSEGRALEYQELFIKKDIAEVDGTLVWRTQEIEVGESPLIEEGAFVSDSPGIVYLSIESGMDEIINVDNDHFTVTLPELMSSAFRVIHTTDNPRSWPDKFHERPTIIDTEVVDDLWQLSQSRGNQRKTWTRVASQYERVAPNQQRPAGVSSSIQLEEGMLSVPIGMTGEGSQALLRLIDQLERGPSIMAIEEPETHLHPALIKQVGKLLAESTSAGKQLFICTHSPFLVEQSTLDSFFVVKKDSNATYVSQMQGKHDLQNLLYSIGVRPSDILFSDAILLVEGLSDEIFFNAISNKVNASLAERHVKIVCANGKNRGKYKIEFWSEVGREAGLPLYLILDKNARKEADEAISKKLVGEERCLILPDGDLEDHYPWPALQESLLSCFGKSVEEPIPVGERVKVLGAQLRGQGGKNAWKPQLAEAVSQVLRRDDIETHLRELVSFLRNIHGALKHG